MNTPRYIAFFALVTLVTLTACNKENNPTPVVRNTYTTPAPDNTVNNKGDGKTDATTPMDQSQASADIKITADIRRAIMDDKTMSINAQNSKIITEKSGLVTLRGVVNSQAEKDSIEVMAKAVAGVVTVNNLLEVKTN